MEEEIGGFLKNSVVDVFSGNEVCEDDREWMSLVGEVGADSVTDIEA